MRDVVCLMGPTASGKTAFACDLVRQFPFEIISVDSAMVYRGMDIGTAKPDKATLDAAPHRLIDLRDPDDPYSVAAFCEDATVACESIFKAGKIPLLVGGSMMYFRSFQTGLSSLPEASPVIRAALLQEADEQGLEQLYKQLKKVDAVTAKRLHPNDSQRIQRALEVYQVTGKTLSELLALDKEKRPPYRFINLALVPENRTWLHARIAERFDSMLHAGFLDEVDTLCRTFALGSDDPAMRSVGYRQALDYRQGVCDYATFRERGVAATRQLAKRQLTWLRSWPHTYTVDPEKAACFEKITQLLEKQLATY